ncbi:MAG: type III pantothenate kinase [Halioglobus sp.]
MKRAEPCLQLDVGNSSAKWRLLRAGNVVSRGRYQDDDPASRETLLACAEDVQQIWVSSVASAQRNNDLAALFFQRWAVQAWFARSAARTGNLCNSYAAPERMGVDRWLAMLGAIYRQPGRVAVIDAGSALTIDRVAASGQHEGGYIIPGPALMERALLLDTDRVRFAEDVDYALNPGQSTAEAVRHGIAAAQAGAVKLVLERADIAPEQCLFCGGGAEVLAGLMGIEPVIAADLVFEGLEIMARLTD